MFIIKRTSELTMSYCRYRPFRYKYAV